MPVTLVLRDGRHLVFPHKFTSGIGDDDIVRELNVLDAREGFCGIPLGSSQISVRISDLVALIVEPEEAGVEVRTASPPAAPPIPVPPEPRRRVVVTHRDPENGALAEAQVIPVP